MFNKKIKWKCDFEESVYKIYDWNNQLTGYFFPNFHEDINDDEIFVSHKNQEIINSGSLLIPFIKLDVFDLEEGMSIEYVFESLSSNIQRVTMWKNWLHQNSKLFDIVHTSIFTSREDRNMLSIIMKISHNFKLGEKNISSSLSLLMDKIHEDGLI